MNRFKIAKDYETEFVRRWKERDSRLEQVPGFQSFSLLKGPEAEDHILFASHTVWASREDFDNWTTSDNFRAAHARASMPEGTYLDRPNLELFEKVV